MRPELKSAPWNCAHKDQAVSRSVCAGGEHCLQTFFLVSLPFGGRVISSTPVISDIRSPKTARLDMMWERLERAGQAEQRGKCLVGRENSTCQVLRGDGHGLSTGMKEHWYSRSMESKGVGAHNISDCCYNSGMHFSDCLKPKRMVGGASLQGSPDFCFVRWREPSFI